MSIADRLARLERLLTKLPPDPATLTRDAAGWAAELDAITDPTGDDPWPAVADEMGLDPEDRPVVVPPERWSGMALHDKQRAFWHDQTRFQVVPCGRRSGKTELAKRKAIKRAIKRAMGQPVHLKPWYIFGAPTHQQAKRLFWADLKAMVPTRMVAGDVNESELLIRLHNGAELQVVGLDVPARVEGKPLDGAVLDETDNLKRHVWTAHVRPALMDRQGWAIILGVPEGRATLHDLYTRAIADESGLWSAHHWTTEEILPLYLGEEAAAAEIESARRDLDDLTYRQEYLADFVTFQGQAYYPFTLEHHASARLDYLPGLDLIFCFDFNVSPGVAVIAQEQGDRTCLLGEVYIPRNSNTPAVCRRLAQDWGHHRGTVRCYGDATGGARGTAKVEGSDWDLIDKHLRPAFPRLRFHVPKHNPPERSRVNAMNSRLMSADGTVRLVVDPARCPQTVRDFEGVRVLEGGAGELDKGSDPALTHLTDAVGYYIAEAWPVTGGHAVRTVEV